MLHLCSCKRDSGCEKIEVQTEYTICIFKQQRHSRRRTKARHSQRRHTRKDWRQGTHVGRFQPAIIACEPVARVKAYDRVAQVQNMTSFRCLSAAFQPAPRRQIEALQHKHREGAAAQVQEALLRLEAAHGAHLGRHQVHGEDHVHQRER